MSIGPRSRKKRPRNDLDDYLDEVDSRLFCVTRADRQCLHRDLKAHVRELTTDERGADRYGGRYQISMGQLREEIGEPDDIASMYISSVKTKVPSIGLRLLIIIMICIFLGNIFVGYDRYQVGVVLEDVKSTWLITSGLGLIFVGAIASFLTFLTHNYFERYYKIIAYLALLSGLMTFPLAIYMARVMIGSMYVRTGIILQDWYGFIILIDVTVIIIIGLSIYLRHFQVMSPKIEIA